MTPRKSKGISSRLKDEPPTKPQKRHLTIRPQLRFFYGHGRPVCQKCKEQFLANVHPTAVPTDTHTERGAPTGETTSEAPKEDNGNQDDFDAAYEEFIGADESVDDQPDETDEAAEEAAGAPEDDTPDDATPGQDSGAEGGATEAEGEAGEEAQADSEGEPEPEEDLEKLRQKLKSAEGRLSKFEESVAEMRERLEKSQPEPEKNPQAEDDKPQDNDGEFVPPGMDKDDWLDLQEDYPDTAKLLKDKLTQEQAESRKIKEQQEKEADELKAREAFRQHILNDHPDYDTEILPRMDDLKCRSSDLT